MSELIERLRQHWLNQGIDLGNGASEFQVEELESKYQIILPDDFKEYLLSISWPEEYEMDDSLISFWTIIRIGKEYSHVKNAEAKSYLAFADFFAISHEYAIKLQPQSTATSPVFFAYSDHIQIASFFTEFLERYIADDADLLFPDANISNISHESTFSCAAAWKTAKVLLRQLLRRRCEFK